MLSGHTDWEPHLRYHIRTGHLHVTLKNNASSSAYDAQCSKGCSHTARIEILHYVYSKSWLCRPGATEPVVVASTCAHHVMHILRLQLSFPEQRLGGLSQLARLGNIYRTGLIASTITHKHSLTACLAFWHW